MDNTYSVEKFENSKNIIIFFGSQHSKDKNQLIEIEKRIKDLQPNIILVEGNYNLANYKSKEESVLYGGEMGFVSYLAKNKKIKLLSNDPPEKRTIMFVTQKYGKDFCFLYSFMRNINHYLKDNKGKMNGLIEYTILKFKSNSNWDNYEYTFQNLKKIFKSLMEKDLDIYQDFSDYFNPNLSFSIFNKISRDLSEFRDSFTMNLLKEILIHNRKIFIIKGKSHLYKQKNKISSLLK